jgi:uncharacterized protein (DUF952 family)
MRVHHVATRADWEAARATGTYTTSTAGRSLAEEGFIHAARREQVPAVVRRHYAGVHEPLVLLTIDTDRLSAPWTEEQVGEETFPHIHGPLEVAAVVDVQPLARSGVPESVASLFLREMGVRMGLAVVVMLLAFLGARVAGAVLPGEYAEISGAAVVLVVGGALSVWWLRQRG